MKEKRAVYCVNIFYLVTYEDTYIEKDETATNRDNNGGGCDSSEDINIP